MIAMNKPSPNRFAGQRDIVWRHNPAASHGRWKIFPEPYQQSLPGCHQSDDRKQQSAHAAACWIGANTTANLHWPPPPDLACTRSRRNTPRRAAPVAPNPPAREDQIHGQSLCPLGVILNRGCNRHCLFVRLPFDKHQRRAEQDSQVEHKAGVLHIFDVVFDPLLEPAVRQPLSFDLPQPRNPGSDAEPGLAPRRAKLILRIWTGPGPDQGHMAHQHVEKLRQLIKLPLAQKSPTRVTLGSAGIKNCGPSVPFSACRRCFAFSAFFCIDRNFKHGNFRPPSVSRRWAKKIGRPSSIKIARIMNG